jgi:S-adenosylmethionine:tRNA ribosyltransferase-isomerase
LLVVDRATGALSDRHFVELPALLRAGDLLVVNDTRVFAARLLGRRLPGGGAAECLLVRQLEVVTPQIEVWEALVHPGQRLKEGSRIELGNEAVVIHAEILARRFHGRRRVRLWTDEGTLQDAIDAAGHVPLPPYIKRDDDRRDRERYQTVYARQRGSIAAPTAGLHFTPELLSALDAAGVERTTITLHVGSVRFSRCGSNVSSSTAWKRSSSRSRPQQRAPSTVHYMTAEESLRLERRRRGRWNLFRSIRKATSKRLVI